jgi:hypothetical protein
MYAKLGGNFLHLVAILSEFYLNQLSGNEVCFPLAPAVGGFFFVTV